MGASRSAVVPPAGEGELFSIETRADDAAIVLVLRGELDVAGRRRLVAALQAALGAGHTRIALDLGGLAFIDGSSVGLIERAGGGLRARGGSLTLRHVQPQVRRVIEQCAALCGHEDPAPLVRSLTGLRSAAVVAVGP